jgi:hypothetical protein
MWILRNVTDNKVEMKSFKYVVPNMTCELDRPMFCHVESRLHFNQVTETGPQNHTSRTTHFDGAYHAHHSKGLHFSKQILGLLHSNKATRGKHIWSQGTYKLQFPILVTINTFLFGANSLGPLQPTS